MKLRFLLGGSLFSSLAHATPQLHCPPGQHTYSPPEAVVLLASLLFAAAPLLVGVGLAVLYSKRSQGKDSPAEAGLARLGRSGPAIALVVLGVIGSVMTSFIALVLLVSGAWVRCV